MEARDQVRITVGAPDRCTASTFFINLGCTYGPFFIDLDINYRRLPRTTNFPLVFFFLRVLYPKVGLPVGDLGPGIPMGERPSPPP